MHSTSDRHVANVNVPESPAREHTRLARAAAALHRWRERSRSRRELAAFDDYQLRDLGLSRSQAQFEAGKAFFSK